MRFVLTALIGVTSFVLLLSRPTIAEQSEAVRYQVASLSIARTTLELGMSKDEVAERLSPVGYKLKPMSEFEKVESLLIISKSGPPFNMPGSVTFKDGKVEWISKKWGDWYEPEAMSLGNALFSALSKKDPQEIRAIIRSASGREPDYTSHDIEITLEHQRNISILVLVNPPGNSAPCVSMSESIGKFPTGLTKP